MTEPSVNTTEGRAALRERMDREDWNRDAWLVVALDELEKREDAYHGLIEAFTEERHLREQMERLLTLTANALKGEPAAGGVHSWHDLDEVARRRISEAWREGRDAGMRWRNISGCVCVFGADEETIERLCGAHQAHEQDVRLEEREACARRVDAQADRLRENIANLEARVAAPGSVVDELERCLAVMIHVATDIRAR